MQMSNYQQNQSIYCQQENNFKKVGFVCIFDKYCMYRQFTSYIFSVLFILLLYITFF